MEEICECQKVHSLSTEKVEVSFDALSKLTMFINSSCHKKIRIFFDREDIAKELKGELKKECVFKRVDFFSTYEAEKLEDEGETLVLAVGSERVISVAKYYSYIFEKTLSIFPLGNFLDCTFSKFARLFDGIEFVFFETVEPKYIFVSLEENGFNPLQSNYISSKFVAFFDGVVASEVFGEKQCPKMKSFFKKTLKTYKSAKCLSEEEKNSLNIWTLIRIGQAMSFFGQTKFFFGGDRAIVEKLNMISRTADYLELETIALKLVINSYSLFFSSFAFDGEMNLNRHIDCLVKFFKLSPSMVIKRLASSQLLSGREQRERLKNHYPFLSSTLDKMLSEVFALQTSIDLRCGAMKKYGFSPRQIELCFSLSADFCLSPCGLHLLLSFGFMDKLF